jgi:CubicO group peptidase (beta-lactamase class C family)
MNPAAVFSYSTAHNGRAVVIRRNDALVAEAYQNGFSTYQSWWLRSGGKSFSSVLAAKLVSKGLVPSLDSKISDVITEWQSDPVKINTTLRQLLSLTSGLDAEIDAPTYGVSVAVPMPATDVGRFKYGSAPFSVFGEYVNRIVRPLGYINPAHYLNVHVLSPTNVSIAWWTFLDEDVTQPNLAGGAGMICREWAEYGDFMRRGGKAPGAWGQQIIPSSLLAELTEAGQNYWAYGMNWWRTVDDIAVAVAGNASPNKPIPAGGYAAIGFQNQLLYVLPEINTVVARFGDTDLTFNEEEFVSLIMAM